MSKTLRRIHYNDCKASRRREGEREENGLQSLLLFGSMAFSEWIAFYIDWYFE